MAVRKVLAGVAAAVLVVLAATGCVPDPFEPDGREATASRERTWPEADRLLTEVRGAREPIARARYDGCTEGQNNFKRRDEFSHECFVMASALTRAAGTEDEVGDAVVVMSEELERLGCTTADMTLAEIERRYWQQFRNRDGYGPGQLPEARYRCGEADVSVRAVDLETLADRLPPSPAVYLHEMLDEQPYPADTVDRAEADGAAMFWLITVGLRYYTTRF